MLALGRADEQGNFKIIVLKSEADSGIGFWTATSDDNASCVSGSWQINLHKGDTVSLKLKDGKLKVENFLKTQFMGELISLHD